MRFLMIVACLLSALPAVGGERRSGTGARLLDRGPATRAVYLDKRVSCAGATPTPRSHSTGPTTASCPDPTTGWRDWSRTTAKAMIDEDMAQFARMGWTALRLCSWGDWENSDKAGNLIVNEHVDLLDYLIAKARERGMYLLLTPIHTYNPAFADQMDQPTQNTGFFSLFRETGNGHQSRIHRPRRPITSDNC